MTFGDFLKCVCVCPNLSWTPPLPLLSVISVSRWSLWWQLGRWCCHTGCLQGEVRQTWQVGLRIECFLGSFGDLLVVAHFETCRFWCFQSIFRGWCWFYHVEFHSHNITWDSMKRSSHLIIIKLLMYQIDHSIKITGCADNIYFLWTPVEQTTVPSPTDRPVITQIFSFTFLNIGTALPLFPSAGPPGSVLTSTSRFALANSHASRLRQSAQVFFCLWSGEELSYLQDFYLEGSLISAHPEKPPLGLCFLSCQVKCDLLTESNICKESGSLDHSKGNLQ